MNWNEQRCRVPLPPSANDLVRPGLVDGKPRLVSTAVAKSFRMIAVPIIAAHARLHHLPKLTGAVRLEVDFYFSQMSADLGNRVKALEDALTVAGVWDDDRQVASLLITKRFVHKDVEPYCTFGVQLWPGDGEVDERLRRAKHQAELKAKRNAGRGEFVEAIVTATKKAQAMHEKNNVVRPAPPVGMTTEQKMRYLATSASYPRGTR